jgi:hypothetical protein
MFFKGHKMEVPLWVIILNAAGGDPLRAMEIEERISQEWWERMGEYNSIKADVDKELLKKKP